MALLTDMEELISTIPDKEVADYLREALACYGTGAHRACVVLCHIALFDGMWRKLKSLAPVNAVAKSVADQIEPLTEKQKVFELPLIHKLKEAKIITELEGHILEQINNMRNKAAHPSGHVVVAEEARYVFSEVIQKFLSKPIRETSYIVEKIIASLSGSNYFPTRTVGDMQAVVDSELAGLDDAAIPFLLQKIASCLDDADDTVRDHAESFILGLCHRGDERFRTEIVKRVVDVKSSDEKNSELICMMLKCDPLMIKFMSEATLLRIKKLLILNMKETSVTSRYTILRHPGNILSGLLDSLGEDFVLENFHSFASNVTKSEFCCPEFIVDVRKHPKIIEILYNRFLAEAASTDFVVANEFANKVPKIDRYLALAISGSESFQLLASIVSAAENGAFDAKKIAKLSFSTAPRLRANAFAFANESKVSAHKILNLLGIEDSLSDFLEKYLSGPEEDDFI